MTRPARPRARRPGSRERGSAAAELVLVTPFLFLLLLFAVAAGRLVQARLDVDSAAQQAARAASLARTPAAASAQAQEVAQAALAGQSVTCDPAWSPRNSATSHPAARSPSPCPARCTCPT